MVPSVKLMHASSFPVQQGNVLVLLRADPLTIQRPQSQFSSEIKLMSMQARYNMRLNCDDNHTI